MSHDRAATKAQNLEALTWEGEGTALEELTEVRGSDVRVPILNAAFPPADDATRVHSGQVAQIAGVWVSGTQVFDTNSATDVVWDSDDIHGFFYHSDPFLPEQNKGMGGASTYLLRNEEDARLLSEVYWDGEEPPIEQRFDRPNYEDLPKSPKGLRRVFLPSGPVEASGRIFMSREDALEDARILASVKDLGADESMKEVLESARPTPAYDMQERKTSLDHLSTDTPLIAAAYMADLSSPRPLIAAAALSGAISKDDLRLAAPAAPSYGDLRQGDVVHELRRSTHDRTDAIIVTAASKTLREKANDPDAMISALTKLEQVTMKIGNAAVVGMVLNATEGVMEKRQPAKRKTVEHQL